MFEDLGGTQKGRSGEKKRWRGGQQKKNRDKNRRSGNQKRVEWGTQDVWRTGKELRSEWEEWQSEKGRVANTKCVANRKIIEIRMGEAAIRKGWGGKHKLLTNKIGIKDEQNGRNGNKKREECDVYIFQETERWMDGR